MRQAFGSGLPKPMTDSEIESFIRAFEDCSLPRVEWTHAKHLIMALWYIRRHGRDEATPMISDGIRRFNAHNGNHKGYHETITLAWIALIDRFIRSKDDDNTVASLAAALLQECGERDYLLRFFSRERLFSDEARQTWVRPDIAPIT